MELGYGNDDFFADVLIVTQNVGWGVWELAKNSRNGDSARPRDMKDGPGAHTVLSYVLSSISILASNETAAQLFSSSILSLSKIAQKRSLRGILRT